VGLLDKGGHYSDPLRRIQFARCGEQSVVIPERTLIILALPPDESLADPEQRTAERYPFTIEVRAYGERSDELVHL